MNSEYQKFSTNGNVPSYLILKGITAPCVEQTEEEPDGHRKCLILKVVVPGQDCIGLVWSDRGRMSAIFKNINLYWVAHSYHQVSKVVVWESFTMNTLWLNLLWGISRVSIDFLIRYCVGVFQIDFLRFSIFMIWIIFHSDWLILQLVYSFSLFVLVREKLVS